MAVAIVHRPHGRYEVFDNLDDRKVIQWLQSGKGKRALDRSPRALAVEVLYKEDGEQRHIRMIPSGSMHDVDTVFRLIQQEQDSLIGT